MIAAAKAVESGIQQQERALTAEYYRPEIDGLRGIAVLAVIGFHAFPDYFPGGFVGVDVFFVISGFLISSIILRQLRSSAFTISGFYQRRVRRIFPALLIVLTACLLFGGFALLPDELEQLGKHVASAATFVSNFTLWSESGYFDRAAEYKPLLHLWSLGIEEQFYLLWPILLLLLWKRQRNIGTIIALLTLGSFILCVAIGSQKPVANFYFPFSRFWELGLGCLLAVLRETPGTTNDWLNGHTFLSSRYRFIAAFGRSMLPIVGIGLIGAAIFLFDRQTAFPGWAALVPTAGALCVIVARGNSWFQRRIMASAGLVLIGVISYPLYLWHWPTLSFAAILEAGTPQITTRVVAVLLSFALAWLTFRLFERPVRAQRSTRVTAALAGGLLILGVSGLVIYAAQGFPDRFDLDVRVARPEPRTNSLCLGNFPEDRVFNYCKSTSSEPPVAVFLGDSRAQGIYDGVVDVLGNRYGLTLLARGGCPPLLSVDLHYLDAEGCADVWNVFVKYVEDVKPRLVVIVGGGAHLLDPTVAQLETKGNRFESRETAFKHGLRELVMALEKTSRVVYVRELPRFSSAPSCFLRRIKLPGSQCSPSVPRSTIEAATASYNRIVDEVRDEIPELRVVDSIAALCDAAVCSQRLHSGEVIYSDQLHLNSAGGLHFARASGLLGLIENELAPTQGIDPDSSSAIR